MGDLNLENIKSLLTEQTRVIKDEFQAAIKKITAKEAENEKRVKNLEHRCTLLERAIRKNNIIIFGLEAGEESLIDIIVQKINSLLKLNIDVRDINNARKIGKKARPPIVVEFVRYQTKSLIFQQKEALRQLKGTNIAISNDLCRADRIRHRILREHLKIAREKNIRARIKGFAIEIGGKTYTPEELENPDSESEDDNYSGSGLENDIEEDGGTFSSGNGKKTDSVEGGDSHTAVKRKRKKQTPSPTVKVNTKRTRRPKK